MTAAVLGQVLLILFFHWVADFLLQTQDMATQKSKSLYWLTQHVKSYMFGMLPITGLIIFCGGTLGGCFSWWIINGALHWCTDYATSRWTSKLYATQQFYTPNKYLKILNFPAFFSVIGLDQWIHYACLFTTFCIYT
jgi:hypothetical protein